jgi:aminoglycoside/choline kinase family phosphotransferase
MPTTSIRKTELEAFLQDYFTQELQSCVPLEGDAGLRSYYRIKASGNRPLSKLATKEQMLGVYGAQNHSVVNLREDSSTGTTTQMPLGVEFRKRSSDSYILMDCPPTYCSIEPFIEIGRYLRSQNFSAPEIFHFDIEKGFILLEDLGNLSVKNFIQNSSNSSHKDIYCLIVDALVSLQGKNPPSNLKIYDNSLLLDELKIFVNWYIPYVLKRNLTEVELDEYKDIWQEILSNQIPFDNCLVLKDYHVENMMYLADYQGIKALGLLDFQDALIGSPIYDLVSVLQDARIRVSREFALGCLEYFAMQKKLELKDVLINYHILGAQNISRILGVFVRKSVRDKNDNYLQYIPLILEYLNHDLSHPVMAKLKNWFARIIN